MLRVTHTSSVTEDMIDHLGHMNVRYYGVNAIAGTRAVLLGLPGWEAGSFLVHDSYTRHLREQLLGADLEVRSAVLGLGEDGEVVRIHHQLANAATGEPSEPAVTVNPAGAALTRSPWLIHTDGAGGMSRSRTPRPSDTRSGVPPNSRRPVFVTSPPRASAIAWKP